MKKNLLNGILVFCIISLKLYSNDTLIQHRSGGNEWISGKSEFITIEKEVLKIDLFKDYYHVTVDYVFRNDGETMTCEVGFPETSFEYFTEDSSEQLKNFSSSINNKIVDITERKADISLDKSSREKISKFYSKQVVFTANNKTNIHVEYDTPYNSNTYGAGYVLADYLLGSAVCWNGLETLILNINLYENSYFIDQWIYTGFIEKNDFKEIEVEKKENVRSCYLVYKNVKLDLNTKVKIFLQRDSHDVFGLPWDYNFEFYVYPDYCFTLLTKEQLRKARNLIYAFHGYSFKSKDLDSFFRRWERGWYKPNSNFSENMFNENELKNLELILKEEGKR